MLCTDEVIIFVPCATHGHRMIHEQMKHVSNMRSKDRKDRIRVVGGGGGGVHESILEFISLYA